MKTFYRIEHGVDKHLKTYYLGMYQSSVGDHMQELSGSHPRWHEDVTLNRSAKGVDLADFLDYKSAYLFAFPDLDRLKKWVYKREWLEDLNRLGYVLSVYECDDGYHGASQSVFNWEKAQLKHRINLLEV